MFRFVACSSFVRNAIVKFAKVSGNALMAMHRAMIPLLTMNITRSCVLPDNQKVRKACHFSVQEVRVKITVILLVMNMY
jgi:CRISPR/Cas system CSM-associated protein Csm5 (group 7 of RAMP superfamily)